MIVGGVSKFELEATTVSGSYTCSRSY